MPPLLNSRRYIGASILCLVAVRHAASVSAPNKEEIPHATAEAHTAEARLAFSNGQRVAAAVDLTGQAHAMAEFKDSGRATITTTVVSSDENVDCLWDTWVDWSVCQFSCGGGESVVRTRKVKVMATGNGAACDTNDRETRVCNKNPCPLDCMWDEWSPWGVCSVTCGLGTKTKTREKKQYQQYGGATCVGHWSLATDCEERVCAVDCKWSDWGDWEGCSKSCGTGASSRYRTYAQVKNAFGEDCTGENFQTEKCGMNSCPVDCVMEDWGAWEPCDVTCGTGATRRSRKVLTHPTYGGETCGPTTEEGTCHNGLCPVHCEVSDWSQWSDCSLTCSSENSIGVSKRTRKVVQDNNALGNACDGDLEQTIGCSRVQCPVDCKLSEWSQWSECSTSCGPGISERERSMSTPAQYGGRDCAEESYQKKYCTSDICPVDCQWADWQDWRGCSTTCANGTSYRMRLVQTPMLHGGRECAGGSQQNRACNAAFCPIHCQWDEWTQWSQCSTTCGDGSLSRSREIKVHPLYGGNACNGTSTDTTSCDQAGCPVQCQWSEWSAYGSCTSSCGTGQHSRTREKTVLAQNGGADCTGDGKETEACPDLPACPVDCEWDDWSQWESCSTTCGKGSMKRSRIRKVYEKDGGHTCYGYEDDEKVCESDPCPVDCLLGSWTKWSECSSSCGGGVELRTRQILVVAAHGGVACNTSDLLQSTACEEVPCPIHCVWGHWSEWSTCTKECEGGVTYRHRSEVIVAEYGGKQCEGSARAVSAVPAATARGPRSPATRETMRMEEHKNIARDKKLQTAKTMPLRSSFESETYEALQKLHSDANLIREVLDDKHKLQKYSRSCFSNADVNGDGELSFEELLQCMQKMNAELGIGKFTERHVEHYLQRFDTDQDKLLSQEEFQELYRVLLMVKLEEVEPVDFSRNMFINRRKGKPEDDYRVQGIVGVGSFGVVRKVQCRSTGATRVMKVVDKQKALSGGYPLKLIMEEIDKLRTLDHPAVLRLFEYCADERNLYLITDMLPGGDLLDAVEGSHNKKKYLEEPWVRDVFRQVSEGVAYCHAKGIMHKDLKLENIMLASVDPPEAVVIDVGLAELFPVSEADSFRSADPAGTLATMAPEVVRGSFNAKCDVWSLGCCLYALLCHRPLRLEDHLKGEGGTQTVELYDYFYPFTPPPDESRQELEAYLVRQKEGPNLKRLECSDEAKDLIGKLLTFDKEQRPSMRQALSHCWLHSSKASGQISTEQLESLLQFHRINPLAQAVLLDLSSQLPLKQLREMISLFESVDKDGNGMLDEAELSEALKLAGLGAEMALEAAKRLAKGAGGVVEFSRFVAALAPASALVDVEMLRSSFNRLDANGDGYVSRSELQRLLERGAKPISVPEEEVPPEKKAHAAEKARQAFDGISGEGRLRISFASFQRHLGAFVA